MPVSKLAHLADEVIALYQSGKSLKEVADVYGVSLVTVYNLLVKHNIPRRTLNEANHLRWNEQERE